MVSKCFADLGSLILLKIIVDLQRVFISTAYKIPHIHCIKIDNLLKYLLIKLYYLTINPLYINAINFYDK